MAELIYRGAEAELRRGEWLGRDAVVKRRLPKAYRHPALDARLRTHRTREEALLLRAARQAGIAVPVLYDVDLAECALTMEFVEGPTLKRALQLDAARREPLARLMGREVARLHAAGLIHGDLTTSNALVRDGDLVFVDFGLGAKSAENEDRGVDLHLLVEALGSTHAEHAGLFARVLEGYREAAPFAPAVEKVVGHIVRRGRYRSEKG